MNETVYWKPALKQLHEIILVNTEALLYTRLSPTSSIFSMTLDCAKKLLHGLKHYNLLRQWSSYIHFITTDPKEHNIGQPNFTFLY
jgi:hypothetical protein